jgi:hypothetical protein
VAEEPEAHLLPALAAACEDGPLRLLGAVTADGWLHLTLTGGGSGAALLRAVLRVLSAVAEPIFVVRQMEPTVFTCVTGVPDGSGEFAGHGHLIRVEVAA